MFDFKIIKKFFSKSLIVSICLIACGWLYIIVGSADIGYTARLNEAEISSLSIGEKYKNRRALYYKVPIDSNLSHSVKLNVISDNPIVGVWLGNNTVHKKREYPETRTTFQDRTYGDEYLVNLDSKTNLLIFKFTHHNDNFRFIVKQKYETFDLTIIFLFILIPIAYLGSQIFCFLLARSSLWSRYAFAAPFAVYMIGFAILLRLYYFVDMGHITFQHDYQGHIEFIKFFAENFTLPLPHKAWEYPQQPLYYVLTGSLFAVARSFGLTEWQGLWTVGWATVFINAVSLIYAYRLVRLFTTNILVQNLTMAFLCFTPSLIYMSTRISNDPFAASFAILALFYIVSSYQQDFKRHFGAALFWCTALFLTKVSAVAIEIMFFILLIMKYRSDSDLMNKRIMWFSVVGFTVLSYTLYRAYYPAAGEFHLVNSGIWPGQDLRPLTLDYLLSFNFLDLLQAGQSLIGDNDIDAITHSFPTYQYGTMLFGEFGYAYWQDKNLFLLPLQQFIILVALIVPVGWFAYCFLQKKSILEWMLVLISAITLVLIIKFIFSYPSVSNTDFRYHVASFFALALFFASGIGQLSRIRPWLHKLLSVWATLYFSSNILFIILMCMV